MYLVLPLFDDTVLAIRKWKAGHHKSEKFKGLTLKFHSTTVYGVPKVIIVSLTKI